MSLIRPWLTIREASSSKCLSRTSNNRVWSWWPERSQIGGCIGGLEPRDERNFILNRPYMRSLSCEHWRYLVSCTVPKKDSATALWYLMSQKGQLEQDFWPRFVCMPPSSRLYCAAERIQSIKYDYNIIPCRPKGLLHAWLQRFIKQYILQRSRQAQTWGQAHSKFSTLPTL